MNSFFALVFVRLGLSTVRYKRLRLAIPNANAIPPDDLLDLLSWSIPRAANYVRGASCLTQALAMRIILARNGYNVELRLGARQDPQGLFQAHAWLESNGRVVLGGQAAKIADYATFTHVSSSRP